jgi:IS30 family transposase
MILIWFQACNVNIEVQRGGACPSASALPGKVTEQYKKKGTEVPPGSINFVLLMYHQLTREQRYAIYLGKQAGLSQIAIARQIGVNKSTVSREVRRNSNRYGRYIWEEAHESAVFRRERTPGNRSADRNVMREALSLLKREDWSPRQISGYLSLQGMHISYETIYRRVREDESGELRRHCRHGMKYRHHKKVCRRTKVRNIPDRVSIHDRPIEADGHRFGDWEMDLIVGKGRRGHILTLCERSTNYMLMRRLPEGRKPAGVADAVIELLYQFRKNVHTITTDNGVEFRDHARIARELNTTVFFADSYASWQKGAIENTNKLIRQYIPKSADFNNITDDYIHSVQLKLNRRPRQKLKFLTPKDVFYNLLL